MTNGVNGGTTHINANDTTKVDTMNPHDLVHFDPSLKPKDYQIKGTTPDNKILFLDVNIIDSTGNEPYRGDVYIEGTESRVSMADDVEHTTSAYASGVADRLQANASNTSEKCQVTKAFRTVLECV